MGADKIACDDWLWQPCWFSPDTWMMMAMAGGMTKTLKRDRYVKQMLTV